MMRLLSLLLLFSASFTAYSQQKDSISIFQKITKDVQTFAPDSSSPPDDKKTRLIYQLRNLKGGFNISEAINFKLEEDRNKKDLTEQEYKSLSAYFNSGNGNRWLDNSITWIYRNSFTEKELKSLVRFYRTDAGKKMSDLFPNIMLKSLVSGQTVKDWFMKTLSK
jgi:hypothetical protein